MGGRSETYPTSGKVLSFTQLFDQCEVRDVDGQLICTLDSVSKAEYALRAAKAGEYSLRIPRDEKFAEKMVRKYNAHVKNLVEMLEADARSKTHNWPAAERIVREITAEYGIVK